MDSNSNIQPPKIEAYSQPKQIAAMLGISVVCFLALYFFFNIKPLYLIILGVGIVIAGFYAAKDLLDKSPRVVINHQGVFDKRMGVGTISWKDIKRVYGVTLENIDHICLELYDEKKYLQNRNAVANFSSKAYKGASGISPFSIVTTNLNVERDTIFEAIMQGCEIYQNKTVNTQTV